MASSRIKIDFRGLPKVSNETFYPLFFDTNPYLVLVGGAGSGKSNFAADKIVKRCVSEKGHKFGVFRKVARTLKASSFAQVMNTINRWGLSSLFSVNLTDLTITCANGNQIIFVGLDDVEKLKSIFGLTGVWIEEATELLANDLEQIDLRLRGETQNYKQVLLTFNPISQLHWLRTRFTHGADGATVHYSTAWNNRFVDDAYRNKLNKLKERHPLMYQVYTLGEWGVMEGLIYQPYVMDEIYPSGFDDEFYGLDFGFNDPSALVHIGMKDSEPWLTEVIYESGLTNQALIAKMERLGVRRDLVIYADSAEPDRILEMQRAGFNVQPAAKGQGSVNAGIGLCQSQRWHSKSENTQINQEANFYTWRTDRNGRVLDEPVGINDHAMAAKRYAMFTRLGRPESELSISWA